MTMAYEDYNNSNWCFNNSWSARFKGCV